MHRFVITVHVLLLINFSPANGERSVGELYQILNRMISSEKDIVLPADFPFLVYVAVKVFDISGVNEKDNEFTAETEITVTWHHTRYEWFGRQVQKISLLPVEWDSLWRPGLVISNALGPDHNSFTTVYDSLVKIIDYFDFYTNGTLRLKVRIRDQFKCKMDLSDLPFDTQLCGIEILSTNSNDEVQLIWADGAVSVAHDRLRLSEFTLLKTEHRTYNRTEDDKTMSQADVTFFLKREIGYYVSQVSYLKFLDRWLFLCTSFVFVTLAEIVLQHLIVTKKKRSSIPDENAETAAEYLDQKFNFWCKIIFPCLYTLGIIILFSVYY